MLTPAIRSKVDALWDRFWSGGIANPLVGPHAPARSATGFVSVLAHEERCGKTV